MVFAGLWADFWLHDLSHEVTHGFCGLVLDLSGGVGVGAESEACVIVAQHAADRLYVYTVLESYCGEGVSEGVQGDVLQVGILEDLFVEFCYGVGMVHLTGGG